jgi:tubulin polyglutamylase TTLL1
MLTNLTVAIRYKAAAEGGIEDMFVHLTNVSMQKSSSTYNDVHGGKWHFKNMIAHIEATHGRDAAMQLTDDIHWIFIQSLKAVQVCLML